MTNTTEPTPDYIEEFQRAIKLEKIFLPSASNKRFEFFQRPEENQNPFARFVHYTTAEAALNIIKNKRIWMRNTTCMTDYREVCHGHDILKEVFSKASLKDDFIQALELCHEGSAAEADKLFSQWLNSIQTQTFITSISEHGDGEDFNGRLSMWRAFGRNVARVGIVLKVPWRSEVTRKLGLIFGPVHYATTDQVYKELLAVIDNIRDHSDFLKSLRRENVVGALFNMFRSRVVCCKHEAFHEEREWRVIYSPTIWNSPLMQSSIVVVAGIPQTIYQIPLGSNDSAPQDDLDLSRLFDRLIIGPTPYPWVMYEAFTTALKEAGITNADQLVWTSRIPIRT